MKTRTLGIPRNDYIKWIQDFQQQLGNDYTSYAITGHFGDYRTDWSHEGEKNERGMRGVRFPYQWVSRQQYQNEWNKEEPHFRRVFNQISDKWNISKHKRMQTFIIPEIQETLHLHGILCVPKVLTEMEILLANELWRKTYSRGTLDIRPNELTYIEGFEYTWEEYITKKVTGSPNDIIHGNVVILPFKKN
ncbi:MAG: hypothetical protein HQ516_05665 [Chlorobium sp.]|nr:hypothetical protein [Chlorobium sp.]